MPKIDSLDELNKKSKQSYSGVEWDKYRDTLLRNYSELRDHVQNIVFPDQYQSFPENLEKQSVIRKFFDAASDPYAWLSHLRSGYFIPIFFSVFYLVLLSWFVGSLVFLFNAMGFAVNSSSIHSYTLWDYISSGNFFRHLAFYPCLLFALGPIYPGSKTPDLVSIFLYDGYFGCNCIFFKLGIGPAFDGSNYFNSHTACEGALVIADIILVSNSVV